MAKRKAKRTTKRVARKKVPRRVNVKDAEARLRKALAKQTKGVLIDLIAALASHNRTILRELEEQFDIESPAGDLAASTLQAISDATDFDDREINYNFDYDYQAYATVERNLKKLLKLECHDEVMELSLELMRQGSYQVEMSDEGMMTETIEDCLRPVIKKIRVSDLPAKKVLDWCKAMEKEDRVGFICEDELKTLREHLAR